MLSIRNQLFVGLAISGVLGGIFMMAVVTHQYGLLSHRPLPTHDAWTEIFEHVILPVITFLLLFGVGSYFVVRGVEKELLRTARKIQQSSHGSVKYLPNEQEHPAELRPFITAMNGLALRLQDAARRQESFASDAAHELKTPLAMLALELDSLETDQVSEIRSELSSLSQMIDQLLLLARSNAPDLMERGERVHPDEVARQIVCELAPMALGVGVEVSFAADSPSAFSGLEEAITAATRTLTLNAIRATPQGGRVQLIAGPGPKISVLDQGPGMTSDILKRFKARGVRGDSAPGGEAGLGLSIADRIIEAHGGELETLAPHSTGLIMNFPS